MKNKLSNSIKILILVGILVAGVSHVFAWSEPTVNPPANTAAPIHTGDTVQEKRGGIWSELVLVSPISIFKKSMFLPGNKSVLRIGSDDTASGTQSFTKGSAGAITQDFNTALFGETDSIPLVIDLHDRAQPRDAIEFITDQACPIVTRFTNDKAAAFEFKKSNGNRANIIARQVRLTGGDPDANDVLVGDADGNARWAKASVNANGVVVFSSGTSPVPAGQLCAPSEPPTSTYHWTVFWSGCRQVYDGGFTTNIDPGQQVEYGTATCRDASNHAAPDTDCSSLGAPWPDMDGVSPIRNASNSLPLCPTTSPTPTPTPTGTTVDQYSCHVIGNYGKWIKNRYMDYSTTPNTPKPKCTSGYIPPLEGARSGTPNSLGADYKPVFSEGDVICTNLPPTNSTDLDNPTLCGRPGTVVQTDVGGYEYIILESYRNIGNTGAYPVCTQFQQTCP